MPACAKIKQGADTNIYPNQSYIDFGAWMRDEFAELHARLDERDRKLDLVPLLNFRHRFEDARRFVERAGREAEFTFKVHPHMLRHACSYELANKGHDTRSLQAYLGHSNMTNTTKCTEWSPTRFKDFCR
jgi:site-specific recombinase XerD